LRYRVSGKFRSRLPVALAIAFAARPVLDGEQHQPNTYEIGADAALLHECHTQQRTQDVPHSFERVDDPVLISRT
jgi:hypothetical protein